MKSRKTGSFLKAACLATGLTLASWAGSSNSLLYGVNYCAWINQVMPSHVGNSGKVTIAITSDISEKPDEVSLWGPLSSGNCTAGPSPETAREIPGVVVNWSEDAYLNSWGGTEDMFTATFDMTGAPKGCYDISVKTPSNSDWPIYGFSKVTVGDKATAGLWVKINGRTQVRFGSSTEYSVFYGNSGNIDCPAAVLYLAIPKGVNYTLLFDKAPYQKFLPEALKNSVYGSTSYDRSDVAFDGAHYDLIPLVIKDVPPLSVTPLKINITWGSEAVDYLLRAFWHGTESSGFHPIWGAN